ncbi:DUF3572 domain-containing protein [Pontixanthobacter sp. CEM42]|uniref:DUF3572 domain-containing protein n=1 Tax=Pontixanthobacter sp. CEM42 TaxID=2792077 RepID=UPI001FD7CE72|nr:DUF3572 domain-containing protein [Pontixanthobacter sp. CEM42]
MSMSIALYSPYGSSRNLTILDRRNSPPDLGSASTLALSALGWVLGDQPRADRLLSLTGLTPDVLRDGLGEAGVQAAVLEFLINHEPDLIAAAEDLQAQPEDIIAAHERLTQ